MLPRPCGPTRDIRARGAAVFLSLVLAGCGHGKPTAPAPDAGDDAAERMDAAVDQNEVVPPDAMSPDGAGTTRATITFRFQNAGAQTLYLRSECVFPLEVVSTTDGTTYKNEVWCGCDCADISCTTSFLCGACPNPDGVPLLSANAREIVWNAESISAQSKTGSSGPYRCVARTPIPTGLYQVRIAVYATQADAAAKTNGRVVEKSFTLTTADAVVEVSVQ